MNTLLKIIIALYATASMAFAQVGQREITIDGLPITIVYPTDAKAQMVTNGEFQLEIAKDAKPKLGNQRLVVLSHGTGGSSQSDFQMASTLAKAGYVVAQPLHGGDNFRDTSKAGPDSFKTRPLEISKTIDALSNDPVFSKLFDAGKVGVHGMSAGGATALMLAGAKWNMLTMIKHCAKNLDEDIGFCLSGTGNDKAMQAKRRAQYMAGAAAPEAFLPNELKALQGSPADTRIKAVTVSVPLATIFTADSLSKIAIPTAVLAASNDEWLVPKFHSEYVLANCKSCVSLGTLPNASHMDLLAPWPSKIAQAVGSQQIRGGFPNPKFNPGDRLEGFNKIVKFFDTQIK